MSDPWGDLSSLHAHLWERLHQGAASPNDPFRFTAFATTGEDGAEARMVGLRRAAPDRSLVEVHSDLRTAKIEALRRDPRAALLFWDAGAQVQLRLSLRCEVIVSDAGRWAAIPDQARGNYGTNPAPGTHMADPETLTRTAEVGRFAVISGQVLRMDAVSLSHDPHRRAVFSGPGLPGQWVAP